MNKSITLSSWTTKLTHFLRKREKLSKSENFSYWGTLKVNSIDGHFTSSRAI